MQRQVLATPKPGEDFEVRYKHWFKSRMLPYIQYWLRDFEYSVPIWYNHLKKSTQERVKPFMQEYFTEPVPPSRDKLTSRFVKLFCKAEKQAKESGEMPKNRAISAINDSDLFVMGPIIYFINMHFKKILPGFSSGESWKKQAKVYDSWKRKDFYVVQSDISGWDRSIQETLKESLFDVYRLVTEKVHHVDQECYLMHATATTTKVIAEYYASGGVKESLGHVMCDYQIFSGTSDTKDGNTAINSFLTTFLLETELNINILDNIDPGLADPMEKCEAGIRVAGDDNVTALPRYIQNSDIVRAYSRIFCHPDIIKDPYLVRNVQHGSGLTLKFLLKSETDMIDFCSTNTFYCDQCEEHRIIRKIDRFIQYTPWTTKFGNTRLRMSAYKQQLYVANKMWMDGLPIFKDYNDLLYTGDDDVTNLLSEAKDTVCVPEEDYRIPILLDNTNQEDTDRFRELERVFGREEAFKMSTRNTTLRNCCVAAFSTMLSIRCDLDANDLAQISRDIQQGVGELTFHSPVLTTALIRMEEYISTHKVDLTNTVI